MRIDFNVLWVEDQRHLVEAQRQKLERVIRDEGFRLRVDFASSVEEAIAKVSEDIYTDHIDLILMDYDFGAGKKGDEGLSEIRERIPYRDIVFYSSQANDLLSLVAKARLEGIYCSTRGDLPETAERLFETLVKKVLDIDHSRGIVMGATTDIDQYVIESLGAVYASGTDAEKQHVLDLIKERLASIRKNFEQMIAMVESAQTLEEALDQHSIYTSNDRLQLLRKLLSANQAMTTNASDILRYIQDVIPKRNVLAHVRVQQNGFARKLYGKNGQEYTNEYMKALRLELLDHHEKFQQVLSSLLGPERKNS